MCYKAALLVAPVGGWHGPLKSMRSAGVCVRLSGWAGKTDAAGVCKAVPKEGVQSDDLERNRGGKRNNTTQPAHAEPAVASREQGKGRGGGGGGGRDGSQAAGPARGSVEALWADTGRFEGTQEQTVGA